MESVSTLKFHFFATNRSNFLTYLVWDKGTDATGLKNSLKQGNAVLPQFTDVADGVYDVLVCNQADEQCDFLYSFNTFSLYNAIMDGYAYGVVGIVHLHIASGKITSYDNGWFLYPSNTNQVTCNKSY